MFHPTNSHDCETRYYVGMYEGDYFGYASSDFCCSGYALAYCVISALLFLFLLVLTYLPINLRKQLLCQTHIHKLRGNIPIVNTIFFGSQIHPQVDFTFISVMPFQNSIVIARAKMQLAITQTIFFFLFQIDIGIRSFITSVWRANKVRDEVKGKNRNVADRVETKYYCNTCTFNPAFIGSGCRDVGTPVSLNYQILYFY